MTSARDIMAILAPLRVSLVREKRTQAEIAEAFDSAGIRYEREYRLSPGNIVDFMVGSIAIEVKVKGSKRQIYHQVERYAEHDSVSSLILVSNVAMGFPAAMNGKPVYVHNLAKAWL